MDQQPTHWLTAEEWQAVVLSLRVAGCSVVVSVVPGIFLAWLLARKQFLGKTFVEAALYLPLVLPPVVVGYALLLMLGRRGWVGGFLERMGIEVAFTWSAAVIASAVMAFPLLVGQVRLAIELVDPKLEEAARTLRASHWGVFFTVTLPLALPGVLSGLVLCFARSLGEFGATITFAGNIAGQTRTLPSAFFTYSQVPGGEEPAMRLIYVSVLLSVAALFVSQIVSRHLRRMREA